MLTKLLNLCEGNSPVNRDFSSQRASSADLRCFRFRQQEQFALQTLEVAGDLICPNPVRRYCQGNKGSKIPRFPAYHVSLLLLDCCRGLRLRYSYGGHKKIAKPLYCGETRFTQRKIASWFYCTIAFDINVELIHYVTRYNTPEFVWINGHPMPSFYCILWGLIQIYSV